MGAMAEGGFCADCGVAVAAGEGRAAYNAAVRCVGCDAAAWARIDAAIAARGDRGMIGNDRFNVWD